MTNEIVEPELEILNHIIVLRKKSCETFTACDICPFNIEVPDAKYGEDEYQCKLEQSARALINTMFGREEIE